MPAIEVDEWQNDDTHPGHVKRVRGRLLDAVARDIDHLLESNRVPCDYWSDNPVNWPDKKAVEFPKGDPYVRLECGSNEGYSLYVGVTEWKEVDKFKSKAPSCELARINGVVCHETGCPDNHLFVLRECKWCGSDFEPAERGQKFCDDSCQRSYHGLPNDEECDIDPDEEFEFDQREEDEAIYQAELTRQLSNRV